MSDLLDKVKAALEGATPGPWDSTPGDILSAVEAGHGDAYRSICYLTLTNHRANAALIAFSPDMARALIAAEALATLLAQAPSMINTGFAAGAEEREGGSDRRQGKLMDKTRAYEAAVSAALAAFRKAMEAPE